MNGVNLAGSAAWNTAVFFVQTTANNGKERLFVMFDVKRWTAGDWTCCTLLICTVANAALSKSKLGVAANLTGSVIVIVKWTHNRRSDLNLEHERNNVLQTENAIHMGSNLAKQALQIQTHQQVNETQRQLVQQQTQLAQQEGQRAAQFEVNAQHFQATANQLTGENTRLQGGITQLEVNIAQLRTQMTAEGQQRATLEQTLRENQTAATSLRTELASIQGIAGLRDELVKLRTLIPRHEQRLTDLTQQLEQAQKNFTQTANQAIEATHQTIADYLQSGCAATAQPLSIRV